MSKGLSRNSGEFLLSGRSPIDPLRVSVMTPLGPGGKGGIDRQMDALGRALARHPELRVEATFHTTRGEGPLIVSAWLTLAAMASLVARKMSGRVDVVHINLAHSGSVYRKGAIGKLCYLLGIPYVIHLHGSMFRQTWNEAPAWLSKELRLFFERSAFTLVLGKVWAAFVSSKAPGVADRIFLSPTASEAYTGGSAQTDRQVLNILFLGRLGERKGVPHLVAALKLLETETNWHADLAGDGEIVETQVLLRKLGLADRVGVPGWVSDESHERLFGNADILVLPSLNENLPMTIVEAFSRGVPVIATPVGAISDIVIDGVSGLLVEPGNAEQIAAALKKLLHDKELRARLAAGGLAVFNDRLNIESYTVRLADIWRRAAASAQDRS